MWVIEHPGTMDSETYSEAGTQWDEEAQTWRALPGAGTKKSISAVGAAAYAEHPTTEVLVWCYKLPGDNHVTRWRPGQPNPQRLFDYLAAGGLIEAHNVMFERLIWEHVCQRLYGWPVLPAAQLRCSMAKARVLNLPGALANLTEVLGTAVQKDADGKRLLDKFSVPRKPTKKDPRKRIRPEEDPEDGERLYGYCDTDVLSEEMASHTMFPMSRAELEFWQLDQQMNWRGIGVDIAGVNDMICILEQALDKYGQECLAITGGIGPSQVQKLQGWLSAKGVHTASLDAEAIDEALGREGVDPQARRVLEIRSLVGSASVKKLYAMQRTTSRDGRVRNVIIHHGARTGRPTGDLVQPLNLPKAGPDLCWCPDCSCPSTPRPVCPWCGSLQAPGARLYKWPDVPKALEGQLPIDWVMLVMATRSLAEVERFFGDALLTISGCVRGMLQADPGNDLISSDYSAIEAVVTAALAGCQWRLDAFAAEKDIYLASCVSMGKGFTYEEYVAYRKETGAHHPHRQKYGKTCLSPQTQVLTNRGWLAIVDVLITDKLWDGLEWVTHGGLIDQGTRETMLLDGVRITPDHQVNTNGFWREAESISTNAVWWTQALATGSESLRRLAAQSAGGTASSLPKSPALVVPRNIGSRSTISETGSPRVAILALKRLRARTEKCGLAMQTLCRTMSTAVASWVGSLLRSPGAIRQRQVDTPAMVGGASGFAMSGEPTNAPFSATSRPLRGGTTQRLRWIAETPMAIMSRAISALSPRRPTPKTSAASTKRTSKSFFSRASSLISMNVYDLANAGPRNRFTIKTASGAMVVHNCELALGFGGWVGAWLAFDPTTPESEIKDIILAWRAASPEIVEMWGGQERGRPWDPDHRLERFGFEGAFINAIQYPDQVWVSHGIRFFKRGDAVIVKLLSDRELTYHQPRLHPTTRQWAGEGVLEITYMAWNSNPKYGPPGWGPMKTYAGRLAENIVQATAHDIQRFGILALEAAGYPVVLHVYDEDVAEVPQGFGSIEEFEAIMARMPPWAEGWPIKASGGWRGRRYRKA